MLRLQNVENPNHFLAIREGHVGHGDGGPHCEFAVFVVGQGVFALRVARDPNHGEGTGVGMRKVVFLNTNLLQVWASTRRAIPSRRLRSALARRASSPSSLPRRWMGGRDKGVWGLDSTQH
jgi:hypothetical protein